MSARRLPTKTQLDAMLPRLEALTREWVERECISFDEAVLSEPSKDSADDGSIWDMPEVDSKRVVSLLGELEKMIGGDCKLPVSVIKSGGYASADDLVEKLFSKIREKCPDTHEPRLASTAPPPPPSARRSAPGRV